MLAWYAMVGVRVSSAAATEERPAAGIVRTAGKPSGTAHTASYAKSTKRAYNPACKRASQAIDGGTWYRGRWHSRQALASLSQITATPPRRKALATRSYRERLAPNLSVLVWNAGGLASGLLQEFMAWCEVQSQYDAVILLETHWRETSDYKSGRWHCIHTSGYSETEAPDRYAGILCMISDKAFSMPSVREVVPGRILQVQTQHLQSQRTVTLLGVYQHVRRPHLGTQKNKEVRGIIWHKLQNLISATPARHMLVIAGDFNSTLRPEHPYVGPAAPARDTHENFDSAFQAILREHRLTAANTWHARPSHTYVASGVKSQIDYVLVRLQDASRGARHSSPVPAFPVGAHRHTNHLPLHFAANLLPIAYQHSRDTKPKCVHDAAALQLAVLGHTAQAQALVASVEKRLQQQPPCPDLCAEHDAVNQILLEETQTFFPPAGRCDGRVSAHPAFRASASATWELRRRFKRSGLLLVRNVFDRLKYYTDFLKASKALRSQSQALKKKFLQDQLNQAEQAARQGDQRALFLVARRLAPRSHGGTIRPQDSTGKALGSHAAMQAIVAYSTATFAASPQLPLQGTLDLGVHTFSDALNVRKAVPGHCAPAASWRLCSSCVSERLGPSAFQAFCQRLTGTTGG